jgi:hypothetical protein
LKAQDWQDPDQVRNLAIAELAEVCAAMGLSWSASEKQFVIALPDIVVTRVTPVNTHPKRRLDLSIFGTDKAPNEADFPDYTDNLPTELLVSYQCSQGSLPH